MSLPIARCVDVPFKLCPFCARMYDNDQRDALYPRPGGTAQKAGA